jgi:nitroimidazol reductase NimA-like FMN-containing flavoprotein (pyridoxamine 5'-phosphate oxidase superfamily)
VYLSYHQSSNGNPCFYGFTTLGQKVEWMRANPRVCVEVDLAVAYDQWMSVIAIGLYEELPETAISDRARGRLPEQSDNRQKESSDYEGCDNEAWQILKTHPAWQEPGSAAWAVPAHRGSADSLTPVFYRIRIDHVTGHEATRDAKNAIPSAEPDAPAAPSLGDQAAHSSVHVLPSGSRQAES